MIAGEKIDTVFLILIIVVTIPFWLVSGVKFVREYKEYKKIKRFIVVSGIVTDENGVSREFTREEIDYVNEHGGVMVREVSK